MKIGMISFDFEHHNTVDEMLDDAKHFGMTILDCGVDQFLDDPAGLDVVRKKMETYGIEIESGFGDNYIELADKQPTDRFEALCKKVFSPLGIKTLATAAGHPSAHHRWHKDPPLEEQLQRMAAAIKNLAPVAEQYGITICIENHADYRVREIIRMLDIINSPNVRAKFDCANCLNVMEDPVDAARIIAPFVRSTHLKDNSLAPYTNGQMLCITPQILGEGDVDIATVVHILVQNVRDPQNLPWIIEIDGGTPPGKHSYESGIGNSVRYLRSLLEKEGVK
jgi:sugar phosphate isomerase/epimerase